MSARAKSMTRRDTEADPPRPARDVRGGDGPGQALAVMGLRTGCGARTQRRPVFGGLRGGRVQPRGRRPAAGRAGPPLRQICPRAGGCARSSPTADRVERLTDEFPSLSVAAYNGANTVLSGPAADLEQAVAELTDDGARCDWLDTSHAFHSALLDPALDEFESYANGSNSVRRNGFWCATGPVPPSDATPSSTAPTGAAMRASRSNSPRACDAGRARLRTAARGRPAAGADRRSPAGLAGPGDRTEGGPVAAPQRRRPPPGHRSPGRRLRRRTSARLRCVPAAARTKLDLPTYPFQHRQYWFSSKQAQPNSVRRRAHRSRPAARGRPNRGTRRTARRRGRRSTRPPRY